MSPIYIILIAVMLETRSSYVCPLDERHLINLQKFFCMLRLPSYEGCNSTSVFELCFFADIADIIKLSLIFSKISNNPAFHPICLLKMNINLAGGLPFCPPNSFLPAILPIHIKLNNCHTGLSYRVRLMSTQRSLFVSRYLITQSVRLLQS